MVPVDRQQRLFRRSHVKQLVVDALPPLQFCCVLLQGLLLVRFGQKQLSVIDAEFLGIVIMSDLELGVLLHSLQQRLQFCPLVVG